METEFRQDEIERLVAFERKFGKEGLTFDDVLLLPAESTSSRTTSRRSRG